VGCARTPQDGHKYSSSPSIDLSPSSHKLPYLIPKRCIQPIMVCFSSWSFSGWPKISPSLRYACGPLFRKAYQHLPCLAPVCGQNQAANCDGVLDRKPRGTLNVCVARLPLKVLEKGSWCRKREEYTLCVCVCGRRSINTESTPRHDASTELESQAIGCHDLLAQ
jgi:hypothetical protein